MGEIVRMDPKTPLKISGRVLAFHFNSYLKIKVSKIKGLKKAYLGAFVIQMNGMRINLINVSFQQHFDKILISKFYENSNIITRLYTQPASFTGP